MSIMSTTKLCREDLGNQTCANHFSEPSFGSYMLSCTNVFMLFAHGSFGSWNSEPAKVSMVDWSTIVATSLCKSLYGGFPFGFEEAIMEIFAGTLA